jgi:C4-dicarboxylate-specific signal transduction histidine kinase
MEKLQVKNPLYANIGLLDSQGRMTCRGAPGRNPVLADDRPYFRAAVDSGRFAVGEFQVGRATGKPALNFGMPVYREDTHSLRGVVFVSLDLEQVDKQLGKIDISSEATLFVTDDPRQAVRQADELVAQVMKSLAETFSSERASFEGQLEQARFDRELANGAAPLSLVLPAPAVAVGPSGL